MDEVWIRGRVATHQLSSLQDVIISCKAALTHDRAGAARGSAQAPAVAGVGKTLGTLDRHYEGGRDDSVHEYEHHSEALDTAYTTMNLR